MKTNRSRLGKPKLPIFRQVQQIIFIFGPNSLTRGYYYILLQGLSFWNPHSSVQ